MTTYYKMFKDTGWLEDIENNYEAHKAKPFQYEWERNENSNNVSINKLLKREFDAGYGGVEGYSFILYTKEWIYFPVTYDGAEWIDRVPRHPNKDYIPYHFGGG